MNATRNNSGHSWHEALTDRLGEPFYDNRGILLFQGDCAELMGKLRQSSFDLIVTSPPYNIGKEYESALSIQEYVDWSEIWLKQVSALVRETGSFWLNLGYLRIDGAGKAIPIPYLLWDKVPMYLMQEVVWHYGAGVSAKKSFSPRNEKFLWYVKDDSQYTFNLDDVRDKNVKYPNQKKNGKLRCNPLGKNPSDVWEFPKVTSGKNRSSPERTGHPAQFPVRVIERIVKACSNPGDLILDPFMGSGTVAAVAASLGRRAVGFELRKDYLSMAVDRIEGVFEEVDSLIFS